MTRVIDASALLAFLNDEPGAGRARHFLNGALVSAVNWSEVVQKSLRRKADVIGMLQEFSEIGLLFEPFTIMQADAAAFLWGQTRKHGLSLADRACLALAIERQATVLTADRAWADLSLGVNIELLR